MATPTGYCSRGERGILSESSRRNERYVVKRGSDGQKTLFGAL